MVAQNKSFDQFVLVVASDASKKSKDAQDYVATAATTKKLSLQVVFAHEKEAEALFNKECRTGKQPIAVFFITSNKLTESVVKLLKKIIHKDGQIKIVFLVDSNTEDEFLSSLPQYTLMGVDYTVKICEPSTIRKFLIDISRTAVLRRRQRTALASTPTEISNIPIGEDVLQYQKYETQERYLRSILPMMNIAVIATNSKGKIELWNKKASDYFGIQAQDAVGNLLSTIATDNWSAVLNRIETEIKESDVPSLRLKDELLISKHGNEFYADIYYSYLTSEDGQKIGALYLIQDVTLMIEVDKAKTEFVSLAAHQLRTPTSTINWFAQTLLKEKVTGELNTSQKEYILQIEESSRRMSKLVTTLLDVSRLELGTFSIESDKVSPQELLKNIIGQFNQAAQIKKITLTQTISHDIPDSVSWDANLVQIMVENLISNAIKYSPEKGVVPIDAKRFEDAVLGDSILIAVHDTGYGIPKNQQAKIFTKLFRANNIKSMDTDGTGLGLYLVKTIANKIGARVWFKSPSSFFSSQAEDSKTSKKQNAKQFLGTDFYLTIPLIDMVSKKGNKRIGE